MHERTRIYFPIEWSLKMKKINIQAFATVTAIAVVFILPLPARAQNPSETLFKSKCAGCHGPDGSGSAAGKKLGAHDFHSAEVQKMSDTELSGIVTSGKNKMPPYGKSLKPDDIKGLVAYIRSLAPAK
jgi:mono/diheme cytochrome c family protein